MRFLNCDEFSSAVKKADKVYVYVEFSPGDGDYVPISKVTAKGLVQKAERFNVTWLMDCLYIGCAAPGGEQKPMPNPANELGPYAPGTK